MSDEGALEAGSGLRIVGLGSYLNSDDEIGLDLVQELSRQPVWTERCLLWEGADAATVAASLMEWRGPVLLVDAADMSMAPGEHRCFSDQEAAVILKACLVSTHGFGLAEGLQLARALGFDQPAYIFGVQPFDLSPRAGLTPQMTARFSALCAALEAACSHLSSGISRCGG